jgi:hypothetical protein
MGASASKVKAVDPTNVILEMLRIFPDGLVPISAIFAIITMSFPMFVFAGSMLEAELIFMILQYATGYLGIFSGVGTFSDRTSEICRVGFDTGSAVSFKTLSLFQTSSLASPFPSPHVFMLTVACSYVFLTIDYLSKELEALGANWASRWYISLIFCSLLLLTMITFRAAFSCDTLSVIMMSLFAGIFTGVALIRQNAHLFGKQGINMIGTPLLEKRGANGQPIYLCQVNAK